MKRWILSISSAASILGLAFGPDFPTWLRIVITLVGIACLVLLIISEIRAENINQIICQSEDEIKNYDEDHRVTGESVHYEQRFELG